MFIQQNSKTKIYKHTREQFSRAKAQSKVNPYSEESISEYNLDIKFNTVILNVFLKIIYETYKR